MMTFQKLIDEYLKDSDAETMHKLTSKIDHFIEEAREHNPEMVNKFLMKIDLLLNPHFTEEGAKYVVSKMQNKDGSVGEHWNYEITTKVLEAKGYDFNCADWYVTLNMIYSDFYKQGRTDDTYVELAYDFLSDKDVPHDKIKRYYRAMHY